MMKPKIAPAAKHRINIRRPVLLMVLGIVAVIVTFFFWLNLPAEIHTEFTERFNRLSDTAMRRRGWLVLDTDSVHWSKRRDGGQGLRLFTLPRAASGAVRDLLLRQLPYDCFSTEVRLDPSLPVQNGSRFGIVLLQDRTFNGKWLELSVSSVQAANSESAAGRPSVHCTWHAGRSPDDKALDTSRKNRDPGIIAPGQPVVLRIEKSQQRFRLQYAIISGGELKFRTLGLRKLSLTPRFIGLFAVDDMGRRSPAPVTLRYFRLSGKPCDY